MVNNAGVAAEIGGTPKRIWEFPEEMWNKDIAINSTGVFLGCKHAAAQMIKQDPLQCGDRGWIINTSSIFGLGGTRNAVGYVASKHAVMGITKATAWDCAPYRVHVNALCPGFTNTAFISSLSEQDRAGVQALHPFWGLGKVDDIAKAAIFLASEDNSWITGIRLPVDGGYTSM